MESGEIVGIGDYDVETKREKRRSLLSQLLADPILADVPRNPTLWDVVTSALKKEALCDSPLSNSTAPPWVICGGYEFSYFEGSEEFDQEES
ncbi:hypothetical protein F2Q69_00043487 [Brassica cretica]|uniref:Uncharacterized protein n=1 Tax=Brassica cretica TaxID=69181 RepID=A0A8S9NLH8_BRACR|nr:hypothetical protein F2Q69_00043487 [Brassica cretica]